MGHLPKLRDAVDTLLNTGPEVIPETTHRRNTSFSLSLGDVHPLKPKDKPKKEVDDRIGVKPINWVWHPDSDGPKPKEEGEAGDEEGGTDSSPGEGDKKPSLQNFDEEMREKAEPLMAAHKMGAEDLESGQQTWRCVPMDQIDEQGPEVMAQEGKALFGMKAMPSGKVGIEVPFRPPIYNPLVEPPKWPTGGVCPKGIQGCYRQILRDPNGLWYWVLSGFGEVARSEQKFVFQPADHWDWPALYSQSKGSNMVCHHAPDYEFEDNPLLAPGVHALDQYRVKPEARE